MLKEDKQAAGEMTQASPAQPPHILALPPAPAGFSAPWDFPLALTVGIGGL